MLASLVLTTLEPNFFKQQVPPFSSLPQHTSASKWESCDVIHQNKGLVRQQLSISESSIFPRGTRIVGRRLQCSPISLRCRSTFCNYSKDGGHEVSIDVDFVVSLLQSCSSARECRRIHSFIEKGFGKSVLFIGNNLISVYSKFRKLEDAQKVFDGMPDRNVVSWTALIDGHLKSGCIEEGFRLFGEMLDWGVQPNGTTLVCILNACARYSRFELGKQVHACVVKGNWRNLVIQSALVYFYAKSGDLSESCCMFDRMSERDLICWTTMIDAYVQHGDGHKAMRMFSDMTSSGMRPNEFTVCSILKACGDLNALNQGKQLHAALVKRIIMYDVFVSSSLVCMYMKCGEVTYARIVFDNMLSRNTVTWTSMIAGFAQNRMGNEAINLFRRMKSRRIIANSLTVVSLLSACGSVGFLHHGKEVHAQILKNWTHGNAHVWSTLLWFYCKCGEYVYASRMLEWMPSRDVISWTALISGHTRSGYELEALKYLNDMLCEGIEPNQFTYSTALKACAKIESLRQGRRIHAFANKTRSLSNVFVCSALIHMYAKCGCIDDAYQIFDSMTERNVACWNAMIMGYVRNGLCKEALILMYRMEEEGIKVDEFVLSNVLNACGGYQWDNETRKLQPTI